MTVKYHLTLVRFQEVYIGNGSRCIEEMYAEVGLSYSPGGGRSIGGAPPDPPRVEWDGEIHRFLDADEKPMVLTPKEAHDLYAAIDEAMDEAMYGGGTGLYDDIFEAAEGNYAEEQDWYDECRTDAWNDQKGDI